MCHKNTSESLMCFFLPVLKSIAAFCTPINKSYVLKTAAETPWCRRSVWIACTEKRTWCHDLGRRRYDAVSSTAIIYEATTMATAHLFMLKVYLFHFSFITWSRNRVLKADEPTSFPEGACRVGQRVPLQFFNFIVFLLTTALFSPSIARSLSNEPNLSILLSLIFAFRVSLRVA